MEDKLLKSLDSECPSCVVTHHGYRPWVRLICLRKAPREFVWTPERAVDRSGSTSRRARGHAIPSRLQWVPECHPWRIGGATHPQPPLLLHGAHYSIGASSGQSS